MTRVAILGSPDKPLVASTLERLRVWLAERADLVFAEQTHETRRVLPHRPELLFVLGGDGTLISAVHDLGCEQIPIVAVNLGKLGFLAEFTIDQIERDGDYLFDDDLPVTRRIMLRVDMHRDGEPLRSTCAVNDCVVQAGPPYRMIEIRVSVDGEDVAEMRGDGLIVATPSGSTAHNLSAGGPILEPTSAAFILTPICPHALTFRPLALDAQRVVSARVIRANEGTTVSVDGKTFAPLTAADRIEVRRFPADFLLVRNPRRSAWYALRRKLMWGLNPTNNHAAD